jgi:hypothetical protein
LPDPALASKKAKDTCAALVQQTITHSFNQYPRSTLPKLIEGDDIASKNRQESRPF